MVVGSSPARVKNLIIGKDKKVEKVFSVKKLCPANNNHYLPGLTDGWVAEWLTRLAVNQIPYGVAGSNPAPPNMILYAFPRDFLKVDCLFHF